MATLPLPPKWLSYWFALSTVVVCWDAGYCLFRPRSMTGGDLAWIWKPYNDLPYGEIDRLYGRDVYESGDGFTSAQATVNLIEVALNVVYLYVRHGSSPAVAPLIGFTASLMTCSKTVLYFLQEYFCQWCMTGHNTGLKFWFYYIFMNGLWIVVPFIVCVVLYDFLVARLNGDASRYTVGSKAKASPAPSIPVPVPVPVPASPKTFATPTPGAMLPLSFVGTGLRVLVVGSNRLAASRSFTFIESGATVTILSSSPLESAHEEVRHRVKQAEVSFIQHTLDSAAQWEEYISEGGFSLVCVTDTLIGSTQQRNLPGAEAIRQACAARRIPVNISDYPQLSNYSFPAVHRFAGADGAASNLQIAVSTNGQGCRLSSRIKREIVTRLPGSVGAAVDNVGQLRRRARRWSASRTVSEDDPDTPLNDPVEQLGTPSLLDGVSKQLTVAPRADEQLRRMRWVHQMSEYYSFEGLARMTEEEMDQALKTWDDRGDGLVPTLPQHDNAVDVAGRKGRIFLIGSGPGHPGLLTLAAHHVLKSATLILSDKLVPSEILALIPPTTQLHIAKKFPGNNEGAQNELMIQALEGARRGETVVRLKQGDPFVYGRGGEEVLYFREHGFESTVIPGVTSAIAGPEMVGIPVTQRGVAEGMILCTGVGRAGKAVSLPGYVKPRTLVLLMGVARIGTIVSALTELDAGRRDGEAYPRHLPIAVVERASSPDQRVIVSTLENIEAALKSVEERPPGMMVIGWSVLALEGKGRVDVLDRDDEEGIVTAWMGQDRWRIREGLEEGWGEYLAGLGV